MKDVNERLDELEDVVTSLQIFLVNEGILPYVRHFERRPEPEVPAPCPNPQCRSTDLVVSTDVDTPWSVQCKVCGYRSPDGFSSQEAIHLHNRIAWKRSPLCKPGDPNYGLLCDEAGE